MSQHQYPTARFRTALDEIFPIRKVEKKGSEVASTTLFSIYRTGDKLGARHDPSHGRKS